MSTNMPIDLELLRRFVAVAEAGSFRRAADTLGVSQPPLTRSIQQLEAQFETQLLERDARGAELTTAGKALMEQAPELLAHAERVFRVTRSSLEVRRLNVGFTGLHGCMASAIGSFQARWSGCEVHLRHMTSSEQYQRIEEGSLDVGLVFGTQPDRPLFQTETLMNAGVVLAMPEHWKLSGRSPLRLSDFAEFPFISSVREANPYRRRTLEAKCRAAGFVPDVRFQSNIMGDIHQMVAAGLGVALVTEECVKRPLPGVRYLTLEEDLSDLNLRLSMIWVEQEKMPVRQLFIDHMLAAFKAAESAS